MTSENQNQAKIDELQAEVSIIKKELDKINDVKEQWYTKKESVSEQIRTLIESIKGSKDARNEKTSEVRKAKEERNKLNSRITKIVEELKELNNKRREVMGKSSSGDPIKVQKQIAQMEEKLETEVMSFDKEKAINKKIKELKKQIEGSEEVGKFQELINKKREELRVVRKEAKEKHALVQKSATVSQEKHEDLLKQSQGIDDLRKKEEEAFKEFLKQKEEFTVLNDKLKDLVKKINEFTKTDHQTSREARKEKDSKVMKEKEKSVEEKIKKKEKLTTEDLLVFQKGN